MGPGEPDVAVRRTQGNGVQAPGVQNIDLAPLEWSDIAGNYLGMGLHQENGL